MGKSSQWLHKLCGTRSGIGYLRSLAQLRQSPIRPHDIAVFLRQFATLMAAGIPILQSCEILEKSSEETNMRYLIYTIKQEILSGKDLFSSLKQHSVYFNELTCQLIRIGEHTGKLDLMLAMIATHHEKTLAFRKQITQALYYPLLIIIIAFIVMLSLLLFVVPQFAELFQDSQISLPLLTRCIFMLSAKLKQPILLLPISILFLTIIFSWQKCLYHLQQWSIKLPIIKSFLHKITLARFARHLAMTFSAGLPLTEALKLTAASTHHPEFPQMVYNLRHQINAGLQLHHAMQAQVFFPLSMVQMVKIGEESGMLDHMLSKTADFLEAEIDHFIHQLIRLLEPLIMIVLGVLIGGLVISLYLPIFKLGSAL